MNRTSTLLKSNFLTGFVLVVVFVFGFGPAGYATTYTSNAVTGNWNVGTSWQGGSAPTGLSTDVIVLITGSNITLTASATCASVTMNGGATANTLTISSGQTLTVVGAVTVSAQTAATSNTLAVGAGTLTCASIAITGGSTANYKSIVSLSTGTINCSGNITFGAGTAANEALTFTGAGMLNIQGNLGGGGTFTASTGTVEFNGTSAQTAGGTAAYVYSTVNIDNATGVTLGYAATIPTLNIGLSTPNSIFNDGGFVITMAAPKSLNINSGTYNLGSATVGTTWPAWTSPTINTGTTIGYISAVAQTVSATPAYQNLLTSGAANKTITTAINIAGNWICNGPATTAAATTVAGNIAGTGAITQTTTGTINIGGNWTNSGVFVYATGTVNFNGGNNQYINTTLASMTFYNITLNNSGGANLQVEGSTTTLTLHTLTFTNGTFIPGTATQINVSGNWANNENGSNFTYGTSTVTFNSTTAAQAIDGTAGDQEFYNLIVDCTGETLTVGGSGNTETFTVENNFTETVGSFTFSKLVTFNINGNVTLTAGTFTAGNTNAANLAINVGGNWINNGATLVPSASITTFTGSAASYSGTAASLFFILQIADGATVTASGTGAINCTALTIGNGNSGVLSAGAEPITVSGSAAATADGYDGITINGGGTLNGNTSTIIDKWDFNENGTFTAGTGTFTFEIASSGHEYLYGNNPYFYNLTIDNGNAASIIDFTNVSPVTATNNVTLTEGTLSAPGQLIVGGNWSRVLTNGVFTTNNGLVTFNGTGAQSIGGTATAQTFYDLEIGNSSPGVVTTSIANLTVSDRLFIDNGGVFASAASENIYISNIWENDGGTFTPSTGTVTFNGSSGTSNCVIYTNGNSPNQTFNNITVATTNGTLLDASGGQNMNELTLNGNFVLTSGGFYMPATSMTVNGTTGVTLTNGTLYGTGQLNIGGTTGSWTQATAATYDGTNWCGCNAIVNFDGTGNQLIEGTATTQTFWDLVIDKASGTFTVDPTTLNIEDNFTLTAGTFTDALASGVVNIYNNGSPSSFTFTAGTMTMSGATSTLNVYGPGSYTGGTIASSGTVTYTDNYGYGQEVMPGTFVNLTFDNNGKTLAPATISISGVFSAGTGINYTTTGNTISFTGNTSQVIPAFNYDGTCNLESEDFGYGNLTYTTAKVLPTTNLGVNGVFTYATPTGNFTLGNMNLLLGPNGSIAGGTPSASHMIVYSGTGRLIKAFNTGAQSYTYPIGIGTNYLPVTITFDNVTNAGELGLKMPLTPAVDPNAVAPPATATNWLKDYWVLDNNTPYSGSSTLSFDYYSFTPTYLSTAYNTDLGAGATGESTMGVEVNNDVTGSAWQNDFIVSSHTALNPTASGITSIGDVTFATCTPLVKTSDPANAYVCATSGSSNVSFTVGFTGTPSAFQWYQNGVALSNTGIYSGAQSAELTLTGATAALNGNTYSCSVTGECGGSFTSNAATLGTSSGSPSSVASVTASPNTYHPGANVVITATPGANNPVGTTYEFVEAFAQGSSSFFTLEQNTSSTSLTIDDISAYGTSIKSPGVTWLFVYAESACGGATGVFYQISVIPPATVSNPTTCGGSNGSISFAGLIDNNQYSVSYDLNNIAQTALTLTTSASGVLTMPNLSAGYYSNIVLTVLGQGSSSPSAPADPITLIGPCTVTPYNVTYNNGTSTGGAAVNVCPGIANIGLANAQTYFTYDLYESGNLVATYGAEAAGAFNFSYTPLAGNTYTVTGTASTNTVTMNGSVIVNAAPTAVISNSGLTGCQSPGVVLGTTGSSAGSGTISSYQWVDGGSNIGGAISSTYTVTATGSYSVIITNSNTCSTTSSASSVTISANPTVSFSGLNTSYCTNASAATLTGSPTGGTFSGTGMSGNTFTPSTAGAGGPYSITYSYSNGTCGNTSSQNTTVNASPGTVTVNPSSPSIVDGGSGVLLTATSSGATAFAWSPTTGLSPTSGAILTANPTSTETYTVTASNAASCSATGAVTVTVTGPTSALWTAGAGSTDWFTAGNWSTNLVPTSTTSAEIQGGLSYYPVISGSSPDQANVLNLTIDAGASVSIQGVNGVNLNVYGNLTNNGSASFGAGTLVLAGITAQTIAGVNDVTNMTISNVHGVTITSGSGNMQSVSGTLTLVSGALTTNDNLTLTSTSVTSVGLIDNFYNGNSGSTINGNIIAQRYYAAASGGLANYQHFIGSPVNDPAVSQLGATGTAGYIIPTSPTSADPCDQLQSASNSPYGNLFSYNEDAAGASTCSLAGWDVITSGNLANGVGYSYLIQGTGTLSLTGSPNISGDITLSNLTNHGWSNTTYQGNTVTAGWWLVANPYPDYLAVSSNGTNIDGQVQVWVENGGDAGTYQSSIAGEGALVAPFQAYMVHVTNPGGNTATQADPTTGTVTINATDRTISQITSFFRSANQSELKIIALNTGTGLTDNTTVAFNPDATVNFDPSMDANKLGGASGRHTIYSVEADGQFMSINTLPSLSNSTVEVPVTFKPGVDGNYTFSFAGLSSFDPTTTIMLQDKLTNTMYNVQNGDYKFTAKATDSWDRFNLIFTPIAATTGITSVAGNGDNIPVWSYQNKVNVDFSQLKDVKATVTIYDILGQQITSENYEGNNIYTKTLDNIDAAFMIVRVVNGDQIVTKKVFITNAK